MDMISKGVNIRESVGATNNFNMVVHNQLMDQNAKSEGNIVELDMVDPKKCKLTMDQENNILTVPAHCTDMETQENSSQVSRNGLLAGAAM